MTTLKKALKDGNIETFIQEHEKDAPGDADKLNAALKKPASQKTKEVPKASSRHGSDD
jgi:hypothetical protein